VRLMQAIPVAALSNFPKQSICFTKETCDK
jgi:hypothetical protein